MASGPNARHARPFWCLHPRRVWGQTLDISDKATGMKLGDGVETYGAEAPPRVGFFTDTSVCIGCKACEVACKEWNLVPEDGLVWTGHSYDNSGELSANTWRHVAFIEQEAPDPLKHGKHDFRWLMESDVCKHCTHAGCLDVCPTGAIFRTEFGTVVIQDDVCNGCGYCITACPFGVIGKREGRSAPPSAGTERTSGQSPDVLQTAVASDGLGVIRKRELGGDGGMHKCTLCYDRLQDGMEPACAKACPTDSIQFGPLDELIERARERCGDLVEAGVSEARLYLADEDDGIGGAGAFFLLLDEPEVYGLPPQPIVPTKHLGTIWGAAAVAAGALAVGVAAAFLGGEN
jgi:formate dehydrogenase iron-sulfur subunit